MYAVIETGGKQYRVEVGTQLEVELIDAKAGDTVTLDRVLLVADGDNATIGRPVVTEASVSAEVLRQERGEKVISFKYRPKARRRVKKGHRQELHVLRIADIVLNGKSAAASVKKAEADAKTERQRLEEAARRQAAEDAALAAKLAAAKTPKPAAAGADEPKTSAKSAPKAAPKTPAAKPAAKAKTAKAATPRRRQPRPPAAKAAAAAKAAPAAKTAPAAKAAAPKKPAGEAGARAEAARHEEGRVDPMAHKKAGSSSRTAATASASASASRSATASSCPPARSSSASAG